MPPTDFVTFPQVARTARAKATSLVRETRAKMGDLKGKVPYSIVRLRVLVKIISQHNLAGASVRHRIANTLELLSSSLMMETIARQSFHHPRRAFHSISHVARAFGFSVALSFVASQWRSWLFV